MVVSGRKLGLVAAVGLLLGALLLASCSNAPSPPTTTTTLQATTSTSTSTSVSKTPGISSTSSIAHIGETQSTILVSRTSPWEDYYLALHRLDALLQADDLRMAQVATDINRTAPDIPQVVYDEIGNMFIALQQAEMTLNQVPDIPAEYREAHDLLLRAANHMLMRINQTGIAVQDILNSGDPTSGNPQFQVARNYRDYYRQTFAQYQAALPGGQPPTAVDAQAEPTPSPPSTADTSPEARLFSDLSGDGYAAYVVNHVDEGGTTVILVGVWVDIYIYKKTQTTYDAIYEHAISSAKQYGVAAGQGELLRVELVEAPPEQKIIESRDFDLSGDEG